ncbi:TIGR04376 family protein [Calothrix sp. UHCC 0171]|uniref:TIGR04376 family protein n=1 Tax=Calothrix sp. UHCC 0171 TaxID=3110245 RepID=UPI002B1EBB7A|nr:TIGR04376 family protein [Calothrix sp. UHCC 0171]MEA5572789.1 TIGR04376 family protein [Calothrix sp. UHCC 0171]
MGLFDDLSRFLEHRLEEFLRNNPHLELEALLEQLREQEQDTLKLITELQLQEKRSQDDILATATEIQKWHIRIEKAKAANRLDLATAAQEHEASLLRKGNQQWGHMQGVKERAKQAKDLLQKIQVRKQEVQLKAAEAQKVRNQQQAKTQETKTQEPVENTGWWSSAAKMSSSSFDDLEEQFRRLETDDELERLKRQMRK